MPFRRFLLGAIFCCFYLLFYLTNKYVLSVLKFTYPTLFQGDVQMLSGEDRPDSFTVEVEELQYFDKKWQTLVGGLLLALSGKLGWVEVHSISRSAALSWLPGSVLFVGNIYAGSRALSRLPIPIFFTLYNASEVVTCFIQKLTQREATSWMKLLSVMLLLTSAGCLPLYDPQFDPSGYFWAVIHFLCVGGYKVFKCSKSSLLSDLEQQYINYVFSVLLLAFSAHPTGDLFGALEFPYLHSYKFHSGCCASGVLGFFVLLATVRLKSNLPVEHCAAWVFLAKVLAAVLSLFVFDIVVNIPTVCCLLLSCLGEALLVYSK